MKNKSRLSNTSKQLLSRLMQPNLQELSSTELIDLFVEKAKKFDEGINKEVSLEELTQLQLQIATIKDELHRKANLSPEGSLENNFFYSSAKGL